MIKLNPRFHAAFALGLALLSALSYAPSALAQDGTPPPPANGFLMQLPIMLALFALMYFVLIRPQRQQQKKHQEFVSSIKRGDEVVLSNGLIGVIEGLTDKVATIEVSDGVEVKVLRSQVQSLAKSVLQ